jgi:hypothetical protein
MASTPLVAPLDEPVRKTECLRSDLLAVVAGGVFWIAAVLPLKWVGSIWAGGDSTNVILALVLGALSAVATTPLMSYFLDWKSSNARIRGISIGLGASNAIDGIVHLFFATFYSSDAKVALACAANLFYGAGLLGIFSVYANMAPTVVVASSKISDEFPSMRGDILAMVGGAVGWTAAILPVKWLGALVASGGASVDMLAVVLGVLIAVATTPLVSFLMGWKTREARIRGVALALGMAQTIDAVVHLFFPTFYSSNPQVALACAGNILFGAGLLGIFCVYT